MLSFVATVRTACAAPRAIVMALACLLSGLSSGCVTFVDLPPKAVGGVENPIRCDMPEGERQYLRRLRTPQGAAVRFEYLDAVLGPEGRILDRFSVENPAYLKSRRSPWAEFRDQLRSTPELPRAFRLYLDMYHPGVLDDRAPPGLVLAGAAEPDSPVRKSASDSPEVEESPKKGR